MPALIFTTEGEVKPASVPASDHLPWMYGKIGCSTVDAVRLSHDLDLWIDDEGLINGSPVNVLATIWARYFGGLDVVIHGNAILAKHDGQGNTVELSRMEAIAAIETLDLAVNMARADLADKQAKHAAIIGVEYSLN